MSDIDPGTPANGGLSALTRREGVADTITRSPTMTHITDEMVVLAALRGVTPNNKLASDAADLIKRQAEEIAALKHTVKEAGITNLQFTADRAELIAALRPFANEADLYPEEGFTDTADAAVECGYLRNARVLLERLGAEVEE